MSKLAGGLPMCQHDALKMRQLSQLEEVSCGIASESMPWGISSDFCFFSQIARSLHVWLKKLIETSGMAQALQASAG